MNNFFVFFPIRQLGPSCPTRYTALLKEQTNSRTDRQGESHGFDYKRSSKAGDGATSTTSTTAHVILESVWRWRTSAYSSATSRSKNSTLWSPFLKFVIFLVSRTNMKITNIRMKYWRSDTKYKLKGPPAAWDWASQVERDLHTVSWRRWGYFHIPGRWTCRNGRFESRWQTGGRQRHVVRWCGPLRSCRHAESGRPQSGGSLYPRGEIVAGEEEEPEQPETPRESEPTASSPPAIPAPSVQAPKPAPRLSIVFSSSLQGVRVMDKPVTNGVPNPAPRLSYTQLQAANQVHFDAATVDHHPPQSLPLNFMMQKQSIAVPVAPTPVLTSYPTSLSLHVFRPASQPTLAPQQRI